VPSVLRKFHAAFFEGPPFAPDSLVVRLPEFGELRCKFRKAVMLYRQNTSATTASIMIES